MTTPKARTSAYAVFSKLLLASAVVAAPLLAAERMSGSQQRDREAVLIANRVQASASDINARYADSSASAENSNSSRRDSTSGDDAQFKNSASLKWIARKLRVSTATAYASSVILNFLTIALIVVLFLRSKLPGYFQTRTRLIQQSLNEARKASSAAQQALQAIESRFARLQDEISAMQAVTDEQATHQEERIRVATAEEMRKISQAAEQEIAEAVKVAKRDFRVYAAELAVNLAAERVQVDTCTDEALMRAFVQQLSPNGSN